MTRIFFLILALIVATNARADFNEGVVAHLKGDYATAFQVLLPLAQTANHALAQYYVGVMYANGQGTKQDYAEATKWLDAAAKQGIAPAQQRLGDIYVSGKGAPVDLQRAFAWFAVAEHLGHAKARAKRAEVEAKLSGGDLTNAQKMADDYVRLYGQRPEGESGSAGPTSK